MTISSHLLERAYQLIDANQLQNAELVLDAVVRVDPHNTDAWKTYLEILRDRGDLMWLKDRILRTRELSVQQKSEILQYQEYLLHELDRWDKSAAAGSFHRLTKREHKQERKSLADNALFELINEYEYPPTESGPFVNERAPENPPRGPSPATRLGIVLILVFYVAIRMLVLGYFFGYVILAGFLIGGAYWLRHFGSRGSVSRFDPARIFGFDSDNNLSIVPDEEEDTEANEEAEYFTYTKNAK